MWFVFRDNLYFSGEYSDQHWNPYDILTGDLTDKKVENDLGDELADESQYDKKGVMFAESSVSWHEVVQPTRSMLPVSSNAWAGSPVRGSSAKRQIIGQDRDFPSSIRARLEKSESRSLHLLLVELLLFEFFFYILKRLCSQIILLS